LEDNGKSTEEWGNVSRKSLQKLFLSQENSGPMLPAQDLLGSLPLPWSMLEKVFLKPLRPSGKIWAPET
jgi:hypothetical protein